MSTQNPEIQYLRVRHTGETQGSLHLSDLNTEENAKESYKIPVYVPEEGHVDLPLNDQVLLSFNQGSIRRHIDEGRITGHVVSDDGAAEVWVSPEGDDQNPGTRNAPFASIQYAIDTLVDRVGHDIQKKVYLVGTDQVFMETIVFQTKNLDIISKSKGNVAIRGDRPDRPTLTFTTLQNVDQFHDDGGLSFNTDDGFEYTGAQVDDRELHSQIKRDGENLYYRANITIRGVSVSHHDYPHTIEMIGAKESGQQIIHGGTIRYIGGGIHNYSDADVPVAIWSKRMGDIVFKHVNGDPEQTIVFDGRSNITVREDTDLASRWVVHYDDTVYSQIKMLTGNVNRFYSRGDVEIYGRTTLEGDGLDRGLIPVILDGKLTLDSEVDTGDTSRPVPLIQCKGMDMVSGGSMFADRFTSDGNVTGSNTLHIYSGHVDGDLNFDGNEIVLNDVIIEGNMDLTTTGNVKFRDVTVVGDLDVDGVNSIDWKGGSFHGQLVDTGNILEDTVAGENVNV